MDCLFCKIARGEIPAQKIYEDDLSCVFKDINPVAPVHLLVIPKAHISAPGGIVPENAQIAGHLMVVAAKAAKGEGLSSFRIVGNSGEDAGQTVHHLHYHILGGRKLSWPPG
jgi:histidine triad (HIT) family protein